MANPTRSRGAKHIDRIVDRMASKGRDVPDGMKGTLHRTQKIWPSQLPADETEKGSDTKQSCFNRPISVVRRA